MLKVIREGTIFIPNYEDYDRVSWNHGAAVYPQLWPEEMAGEGAIYRWQKSLMMQFHTMSTNDLLEYFNRLLTDEEKLKYHHMVVKTLAWLAERCGWKVKNEVMVDDYEMHPIYVTDKPDKDWWRKPWKMSDIHVVDINQEPPPHPPKDEGITIDMFALAQHMGDMMPKKEPLSRMELQELVCSMLAADNGWEKFANNKYRIK